MFEEQVGLPDQRQLEADILSFWRERRIFEKLRERNRGGARFSFLDGPITANNPMGVHHAWGRTLKDLFQRYWAMRGRDQRYQNGFDCQGLWVEVEVERELGFTSKRDIERFGVAEFVERCKERVERFSRVITDESIRLGCWMDWEHSYYTHSDQNNYAIWHFLKKCHQRGLIYPGTDVMPWCPRCGTGLSQQEMHEGYREAVHPGVVVSLPLAGREGERLLVWTTTPWTLTANVACAVHPDAAYSAVRQGERLYYVAAARAQEVLTPDQPWRMERELPGRELVGLRYGGPFDDLPQEEEAARAHRVVPWDEVSETEGTGIVHIAPGCGKEDYELGREQGLPVVAPIDEDGRLLPGAGPFEGIHASEAAGAVIAALRERGLLYRVDEYRHSYPHCWRCGSELLFRLVDEWYIAMDPWREEIVRAAGSAQWIPAHGLDMELDWLRNMRDWMISKKRYWGLALPIWQCECGWFDVIGSRDELKSKAARGWEEFEGRSPHRPWVDAVKIRCENCGELAGRIPDVGNPWLDAGIVAYSTMGYFDDRSEWERWFPADLVIECLPGQFRNWFYALLAMSAMLEDRPPFRAVVGHAVVVDQGGEEMHKSKGNAIWFAQAADEMGGDVVRWLCAQQPLVQPLRFGFGRAEEVRGWLRTLWNVYSFLATYANVDGWPWGRAESSEPAAEAKSALDRWLRVRTDCAAREVADAIESFNPARAAGEMLVLLDDLSNWWVRRSRRRFWKSGAGDEKGAAYAALYQALLEFARLLAPLAPFTAEALYQRLNRPFAREMPESVHLCEFPSPQAAGDGALLEECRLAREIIRLGRSARAQAGIRVRQPLACAFVLMPGTSRLPSFEQDVLDELNVKQLRFVSDISQLGGVFAQDAGLSVGLDTHITDDLAREGIARDLVRHVQSLRKKSGLRVEQQISLWIDACGSRQVDAAVEAHRAYIAAETLAVDINAGSPPQDAASSEGRVSGRQVSVALAPQGP